MSVDFHETEWRLYDINGAATLAAAAAVLSRRREAGTTEWFPRYDCTTSHDRITGVAVSVRTVVTMPRWSGYESASEADKREWDRFCAALRTHEQGHLQLVRHHFADLDQRLAGKTPAAARRLWTAALAALEGASRNYDRDTDHGRQQGTIIDLAVDAT
jgi:predicted secreted Zn-dependent protease